MSIPTRRYFLYVHKENFLTSGSYVKAELKARRLLASDFGGGAGVLLSAVRKRVRGVDGDVCIYCV